MPNFFHTLAVILGRLMLSLASQNSRIGEPLRGADDYHQGSARFMCGIAGFVSLSGLPLARGTASLDAMGQLIAHRGPDGFGRWSDEHQRAGLVHRRLAIIDLSANGRPADARAQRHGDHLQRRDLQLSSSCARSFPPAGIFRSTSDTEVILAAYEKWGEDCVSTSARHVRVRDLGRNEPQAVRRARSLRHQAILLYAYRVAGCSSHRKPKRCCRSCRTSRPILRALAEYLTFQYTIGARTLFEGIDTLLPGHMLVVSNGNIVVQALLGRPIRSRFRSQPPVF